MRLIAEYTATSGNKAKVYRNHDWNEYVVKFYNHQGIHMDASDYFTHDMQDAKDTAKASCECSLCKVYH